MIAITTSPAWAAVGWTFFHLVWIGGVAGLIASLLRRLLRQTRPEIRHGAAFACLMVLAIAPCVVFAIVYRPAAAVAGAGAQSTFGRPTIEMAASPIQPALADPPLPRSAITDQQTQPSLTSWFERYVTVLPGVWLVGSLLTLGSLAMGLIGVERLRRSSLTLEAGAIADRCRALADSLGIVRKVGVAVCDQIAVPILIGVVRPLILLPSSALCGWSADQIEMALLHELAHLRRRDNLVNLMQRFVESLLFFHPVTWWLSAWVRLERELCCDRLVVARTGKPHAYAQLLASLAGYESGAKRLALAMNERPVTTRIRRILNTEDRSMKLTLPEALGLFAAVILGATLTLASHAEPPKTKPDDEDRKTLERLSISAGAMQWPQKGDQRNEALITIANAQIKLDDRAGALATLNRAEQPALPKLGIEINAATFNDLANTIRLAEVRHKAGDVAGARAQFRQVAGLLETTDPAEDRKGVARVDKELNDQINSAVAESAEGPRVVDVKVVQAAAAPAPAAEAIDESPMLLQKLDLLENMINRMMSLGETTEVRPLIALFLKSMERQKEPMKSVMTSIVGTSLFQTGDADGGRKLMTQAREVLFAQPDGQIKEFSIGSVACNLAEIGELDEAIVLLKTLKPRFLHENLRRILETLSNAETVAWLDASGIKITIGSPSLSLKEKSTARTVLPKLAALARSSGDAKTQARTLSIMAHLQARAGDFSDALATAHSIPDVKRSDYPGPSDGFYDAVKPVTFALIAAIQAKAGDQDGATACFAVADALTRKVEAEDQKLIAQIMLAEKLVSSGRLDETKAVLIEAFPLALTQPEPRRSRMLSMLAESQIKAGDVVEASKNIESIRDYPGIEKASALRALANKLRNDDDEGAKATARKAVICLQAQEAMPRVPAEPTLPFSVSRDSFIDFDLELHPAWLTIFRQTMLPGLRVMAGETNVLAREAKDLSAPQQDQMLSAIAVEPLNRGEVDQALKQVESLESPSVRLTAIVLMAHKITNKPQTK